MSLRLACDLDGVLADMESALVREARNLFGPTAASDARVRRAPRHRPAGSPSDTRHVSGETVSSPPRLTSRQEQQLWRHVATIEGFWETLKEIESGSVARLAVQARERRWEVVFLTKRPDSAGLTVQMQSQRWLEAHGFRLPSVFVVRGSRGRVAAALGLDVVVDDRPENCVHVVTDSHARAILLWRHDPKDVPIAARRPGIHVAKTFDECLAHLSKLAPGGIRRGLVGRMIGRLGFKA